MILYEVSLAQFVELANILKFIIAKTKKLYKIKNIKAMKVII